MTRLPPLPMPTASDIAEATRFIDEHLAGKCPIYARNNRANMIRSQAAALRNARGNREHREAQVIEQGMDEQLEAAE
jgi:hypothetical protein